MAKRLLENLVGKGTAEIFPSGDLLQLNVGDLIASRINPRLLFDDPALQSLKRSIEAHGVLVPLTVYRPKGQERYAILDGERRYRCCRIIADEKPTLQLQIPANVVRPPSKVAGLLYMFSIHNFREQWELMPTALSLETVIDELKENDDAELGRLTGLSSAQVKRCKVLLSYPQKYKDMSLEVDSSKRIPSNFWIELHPVLDIVESHLPGLEQEFGRNGVIDRLVEKYREGNIRSVIHFRRITEAFELAETSRREVLEQLDSYVRDTSLETRRAFDHFVDEKRRIGDAMEACDGFMRKLSQLKLNRVVEKTALETKLKEVTSYLQQMADEMAGSDEPDTQRRRGQ